MFFLNILVNDMLFDLISVTNNPKVQNRSDLRKLRFKRPGIVYAEEEKRKNCSQTCQQQRLGIMNFSSLTLFLTIKDRNNFDMLCFPFPTRCTQGTDG